MPFESTLWRASTSKQQCLHWRSISCMICKLYFQSLTKTVVSTARRRLKSAQSLSGTSTHHTRSQLWSWMIDSRLFRSMSISPPIPQIRPFQTLTLKLQGRGHGCDQRAHSPVSNKFAFFLFHNNQITISEIQLFRNLTLKIKGQWHGWGERSRSHSSPIIQPMNPLFVSHQSDQPFLRCVK